MNNFCVRNSIGGKIILYNSSFKGNKKNKRHKTRVCELNNIFSKKYCSAGKGSL